jgi:electron transfer flavoprotein beta subunit
LALGADKAIYVNTTLRHDSALQPLLIAQTLKYFVEREKIDLILLGKQCISVFIQLLMMIVTKQDNYWLDY